MVFIGRLVLGRRHRLDSLRDSLRLRYQSCLWPVHGAQNNTSRFPGKSTSTSHHFFGTMFSTLADVSKNLRLPSVAMDRGDSDDLCRRFSAEVDHTKVAVNGFEERYINDVKHLLVARCLIAPKGLYDPSTVFLHIQTYKIAKYNPNYLSIFDVMSYEHGVSDFVEWNLFLEYLVTKRIYIIEDWNLSLSSIEILVYDHGIKSVDDGDGTQVDIYKGECDASFSKGIARLSYFIWKGDSIVQSEIFMDIKCDSATEAEIFVGFALISKAKELEIQKLLVCSDCLTLCKILNGQLIINNLHPQRNKYLMIRSMKRHFKNLIVTWKPRELMVFADELAKSDENDPFVIKKIFQKWPYHLKGLPVFRIERTEILNKAIKKFAKTDVDGSFGTTPDSVFYIRVEEEKKLDCIVGIKQSLAPNSLFILVSNIKDKSPGFIMDLTKILDNPKERKYGDCTCFIDCDSDTSVDEKKAIVVIFDAIIPEQFYHEDESLHIILVTHKDLKIVEEKKIPMLTALSYVYFNGVK